MVAATVAVNVARSDENPVTEWINIVAFGRVAEELTRHHKGDLIAIMGPLRRTAFTGRDGVERTSWSATAEQIVSARTVRPGGHAKRAAANLFRAPARPAGGPPLPQDNVDDLYADGAP
jgi:single-stranded DNA-binding protein